MRTHNTSTHLHYKILLLSMSTLSFNTFKKNERKIEAVIFYLSVYWRVLYGVASLLLGIYFLGFTGVPVGDIVTFLTRTELIEDPHDIWSTFFAKWLGENNMQVTLFTAIYFIFWGALDIFLYTSIILKKMWAYTVAMYLITGFSVYMLYRFFQTGSLILLGLICFDMFIVWLTYRERSRVFKKHTISDEALIT